MRIFEEPQDVFMNEEFCTMLSKYSKVDYIHGVPTIAGKTFFWSTKKFEGIQKQFLLGYDLKNAKKCFFIKPPTPYGETWKHYPPSFQNKIRKAMQSRLSFHVVIHPAHEIIKVCYKIYDDNMAAIHTFSFDFQFFSSLFDISYTELFLVKDANNSIVSFGVVLGNLLFIQSSNTEGRKFGANNLLYDEIFKIYENQMFFSGIAGKHNTGLFNFKMEMGLKPIPAKPTFFDISYYLPKILRRNKIAGFLLRRLNKKKILTRVLPY